MTTEEKLKELDRKIEKLDSDYNKVKAQWAKEIKEASEKPGFDVYSKHASKVFENISAKYVPAIDDITDEHDALVEKYNKLLNELKAKEKDKKED